jgi:hypothetical protein
MHALPANIQPRAYFTQQNPAPYRAYDDDGDVYFISGRHGAWAASCAPDPAKPNLYASTAVDKTCMYALSANAPIAA